jgi:glutamate 5-kinase
VPGDLDAAASAARVAATLDALLAAGIVPVLNENDAVALDAADGAPAPAFRDNDMLAALVAEAARAEALVLLSDVAGVHTADPARCADAALLPAVHGLSAALLAGTGGVGTRGRGGMAAKLRAAHRAALAGVTVVIASGHAPRALERIAAGEAVGTLVTGEDA